MNLASEKPFFFFPTNSKIQRFQNNHCHWWKTCGEKPHSHFFSLQSFWNSKSKAGNLSQNYFISIMRLLRHLIQSTYLMCIRNFIMSCGSCRLDSTDILCDIKCLLQSNQITFGAMPNTRTKVLSLSDVYSIVVSVSTAKSQYYSYTRWCSNI